jgi:thymidylate synthase
MEVDKMFNDLIQVIKNHGQKIQTRNSEVLRFTNIMTTFDKTPLVSVRRTAWKSALREMEWFLSGSSNIKDLHPSVHKWWKPWASSGGYVHNNYSKQFRRFVSPMKQFDQVQHIIDGIKNHPYSRRNLLTTWNPVEMASEDTPITNCHHSLAQWFVNKDGTLDMTMIQRSADIVLGVPHNWIQTWAFLMWVAHKTGYKPGKLTWYGLDCHIYMNHLQMVDKIDDKIRGTFTVDEGGRLVRETEPTEIEPIELIYNPTSEDFKADDFTLSKPYEPVVKENLELTV